MQDHEAFILFKQKVNLVIENLENKIDEIKKELEDLDKEKVKKTHKNNVFTT